MNRYDFVSGPAPRLVPAVPVAFRTALLPPDGMTEAQAQALPVPAGPPADFAQAVTAILLRLAREQAEAASCAKLPST